MKKFALIGAAGYIAPRHMKAIKETGNELIAAFDPGDSVGVIDSYFPNAQFFTEFERFDRHLEKLRRKGEKVDYISICSPNYLHDAHIRFALRSHATPICEKPIVLNPWNVDALKEIEVECGLQVHTILQLRLHPSIIELKRNIEAQSKDTVNDVELTYITSRGSWYDISWKGKLEKSGGVATNIGVHFFDMLTWIFGDIKENELHLSEDRKAAGVLHFEKARVKWFLSVDMDDLPQEIKLKNQRTYRSIVINNHEFEFSDGFTDLHTLSYQKILEGKGFTLDDAKKSIEIVHKIRHDKVTPPSKEAHPFLLK